MDNFAMEPEDDDDDGVLVLHLSPEELQRIEEEMRRTLVVKLLNPKVQKAHQISLALPKAWRLTGPVRSMPQAHGSQVQFIFESESEFQWVLSQGPWSFNDWMLVVGNFTERENPDFLRFIDFWVEIFGIPWNYRLYDEAISDIGSLLGQVLEINNQGPRVRARIRIDASQDLDFVRLVRFGRDAEPVEVRFVYEGLKMFCQACGSLSHRKSLCPRPRPNRV